MVKFDKDDAVDRNKWRRLIMITVNDGLTVLAFLLTAIVTGLFYKKTVVL